MPAPPYSSGTVMPSRPISPNFFHMSAGNRLSWSMAAARGASSLVTKARTWSRSMSMVSPRAKLRLEYVMEPPLSVL
ncbi:hypothetical protein D3C78_695000 [compost metagenome]